MSKERLLTNVIVPMSYRLVKAGWATTHMVEHYDGRLTLYITDVKGGKYTAQAAEDFLMLEDLLLCTFKVTGTPSKSVYGKGEQVEVIWKH